MFLKRRTRTQEGKPRVSYSLCESLRVRRDRVVQRCQLRRFTDRWAAAQLREDLGRRAPRGELFVHEQWFPQTAMDAPLNADARVADKWKDRCAQICLTLLKAIPQPVCIQLGRNYGVDRFQDMICTLSIAITWCILTTASLVFGMQ